MQQEALDEIQYLIQVVDHLKLLRPIFGVHEHIFKHCNYNNIIDIYFPKNNGNVVVL